MLGITPGSFEVSSRLSMSSSRFVIHPPFDDVQGMARLDSRRILTDAARAIADSALFTPPSVSESAIYNLNKPRAERSSALASWLFLRLLGIVYFAAFGSLFTQIVGLVGHDGILPAAAYMDAVRAFVADQHIGLDRFRLFPTLTWFGVSDAFLRGLCVAGMAGAALLIAGIGQVLVTPCLW